MADPFGPRPPIAATGQIELAVFDPSTPEQVQKIDPKAATTGVLIAQALDAAGLMPVAGPEVAGVLTDTSAAVSAIRRASHTPAGTIEGDITAIADGLTAANTAIAQIAAAIEARGIAVGAAPLSSYPALIAQISGGNGGGGDGEVPDNALTLDGTPETALSLDGTPETILVLEPA